MRRLPESELNKLFAGADKKDKEVAIQDVTTKGYSRTEAELHYSHWRKLFMKERLEEKQVEEFVNTAATMQKDITKDKPAEEIKPVGLTVKVEGRFFSYEKGKDNFKLGNTTFGLCDLKNIINELVEAEETIKNLQK